MAVDAHCSARARVTAAKVAGPAPAPPSGAGTVRPSRPASARAATPSAGQRACASTSPACRASTSRATASAFATQALSLPVTPRLLSTVAGRGRGTSVNPAHPGGSGRADHLAGVAGGQRPVRLQVDAVLDEADRAVGQGELHPAGVVAAERVVVPPLRGVVLGAVRPAGVGGDGAGGDGAVGVGPPLQAALADLVLADHEGVARAVSDVADADALAGAHDDAVAVGAAVVLAGGVGVAPAGLGPPPARLPRGGAAPVGAEVAAVVGHAAGELTRDRVVQVVVVRVGPRPLGRHGVAGAPELGDLLGDDGPGRGQG